MTRGRAGSRARRRGIVATLAAVLAAGAVVLSGSLGNVEAYYSDGIGARSSAEAGETGVRVTATVSDAPVTVTDLINEIVNAVLGEVPSLLQSTAKPLITTAVQNAVGAEIDQMKTYTFTVAVENTGTLPESTQVDLFDYFEDVSATSTPEQGSVVVSTSTDPVAVELAALANTQISVSGIPGLSLNVKLSDVLPELSVADVIDDDTPDDTSISTDANGPYEGQTAALDPVTLDPLETETLTYTVLVQSDELVNAGIVTSEDPDLNLTLGATAVATGVNGTVTTRWSSTHSDWDGTLVHVNINNPPVIVATGSQDMTPFIGQIGDTANGQPTESAYLSGMFKATDTEDANAVITKDIQVTSDFDPDAAGTYTATANVTDSGGLAADPVSQTIQEWNFVDVAGGQYHALALDSRGRVWGWGYNGYGQAAGDGTTANVKIPTLVKGLPSGLSVTGMAAGFDASWFAMSDGSVYALGYGGNGEMGNGSASTSTTPVKVSLPAGVDVVQLSAMQYSVAALTTDGAVYTWGQGSWGQLGTGNDANATTPQQIIPSGATEIGQGAWGGAAVMKDGTVWNWGTNVEGEMGTGTTGGWDNVPTPVPGATNAKSVEVGQYHTVYLTKGGVAYGYGSNRDNRIAPGSTNDGWVPTQITGGWSGNIVQAHPGWDYTTILTDAGEIWSIGYGSYDSLFIGDDVSEQTYTESAITPPDPAKVVGFYDNVWVLNGSGSMIYSRGAGADGGLGNNSTSDSYNPSDPLVHVSLTNVYNDGTTVTVTAAAMSLALTPGAMPAAPEASDEPSDSPSETSTPTPTPAPSTTPDPTQTPTSTSPTPEADTSTPAEDETDPPDATETEAETDPSAEPASTTPVPETSESAEDTPPTSDATPTP